VGGVSGELGVVGKQWEVIRGQGPGASEIRISNLGLGLLATGRWVLAACFWG
jgi:hypothetical protein